jgi:hypothetical protein
MQIQSGVNLFDLKALRYQYPDIVDNEDDSNWLRIDVVATADSRNWNFSAPCLLNWEAMAIADFFEDLADGTASARGVGFLEPNLYFTKNEQNDLLIHFDCESVPPWFESSAEVPAFIMQFEMSPASLRRAATELRKQLELVPLRAGAVAKKPLRCSDLPVIHID